MNEESWAVIRQDVSLEPRYLVTGHRGATLLWAIVAEPEHADTLCGIYAGWGYIHLLVTPISLGDPSTWRAWKGTPKRLEARNG